MEFDFDQVIDRTGTETIAVDGFENFLFDDDVLLPDGDIISMWVADMAFATAPAALTAMADRLTHPIFGYTAIAGDELFDAYAAWCERHYEWKPERRHFVTSPGIVSALFDLVEYVLGDGGRAFTLTPAYAPFEYAATRHDRRLVTSPLTRSDDGGYSIDFADFEAKLADPATRLFFLCHPHNPTGHAFGDDELRRMTESCLAHDVLVVSDEIHCDLLRTGRTHTPLAKLFPDSDRIVTCMSSSKTFNLAGLGIANVLIPGDELRARWKERTLPFVNPVSVAAAIGVFRDGDEWLTALRRYLDATFQLVEETLADRLPEARFRIPDATYLAWIDLSAYFDATTNLTQFFAERAGVLLEGGEKFVADGEGHVRMNIAAPRSVVERALDRVVQATLGHRA